MILVKIYILTLALTWITAIDINGHTIKRSGGWLNWLYFNVTQVKPSHNHEPREVKSEDMPGGFFRMGKSYPFLGLDTSGHIRDATYRVDRLPGPRWKHQLRTESPPIEKARQRQRWQTDIHQAQCWAYTCASGWWFMRWCGIKCRRDPYCQKLAKVGLKNNYISPLLYAHHCM